MPAFISYRAYRVQGLGLRGLGFRAGYHLALIGLMKLQRLFESEPLTSQAEAALLEQAVRLSLRRNGFGFRVSGFRV